MGKVQKFLTIYSLESLHEFCSSGCTGLRENSQYVFPVLGVLVCLHWNTLIKNILYTEFIKKHVFQMQNT
jgi:hypothetical protein